MINRDSCIFFDFTGAEGITLQVKLSPTEEMFLKLEAPPEPSRKPSVLFIGALVKVKISYAIDLGCPTTGTGDPLLGTVHSAISQCNLSPITSNFRDFVWCLNLVDNLRQRMN